MIFRLAENTMICLINITYQIIPPPRNLIFHRLCFIIGLSKPNCFFFQFSNTLQFFLQRSYPLVLNTFLSPRNTNPMKILRLFIVQALVCLSCCVLAQGNPTATFPNFDARVQQTLNFTTADSTQSEIETVVAINIADTSGVKMVHVQFANSGGQMVRQQAINLNQAAMYQKFSGKGQPIGYEVYVKFPGYQLDTNHRLEVELEDHPGNRSPKKVF